MRDVTLGPFERVSRLTLGGGGLGGVWGQTSADEAVETVRAAVEAGINLIDTAPMYLNCEQVIRAAFAGAPPAGVRITTKCQLGGPPPKEAGPRLEASLDASLAAMGLDHVDIFFLHSNIRPDDYVYARHDHNKDRFSTPWRTYVQEVAPAMERLRAGGRIRAWGITGVGVPTAIREAISHDSPPDVVQAVANLLDSAGGMRNFAEPAVPRDIIAAAKARGLGVMGIRAVQAGALTRSLDRAIKGSHPEAQDFERAMPFRALCAELGLDPAAVAHRYALAMPGVDTVVLGVKNREELAQCVEAEAEGPLPAELVSRIDAPGLRS
jgi:aryl-alcohol dehydrogenase-like predicted oxidoreductase